MKYFLIKMDQKFDTAPEIKGWFDKIKHRNICVERSHNIEKRQLLFIESNPNTVFPDILTFPFFLITAVVRDVVRMYEPNVMFKQIVLLDPKYSKTCTYYLPILNEVDCLRGKHVQNNAENSNCIKVNTQIIGDQSIVYAMLEEKRYIVANLSIVESFLRRGAIGISLEEVVPK